MIRITNNRFLAVGLSFWISFQPTLANNLPNIGSSASSVLSLHTEAELGRKIMQHAYRQLPLYQDNFANDYINALGNSLVAQLTDPHVKFTFFIVADDSVNAFALPGGYIGIHTGLIKTAQNESELAGVIAHEIAHVSQRHIARMLERRSQLTIPTLAAFVTSIAIATQNPSAGTGALAATVAGAQQYAINFTRENEKEADRVGIQLLANSGFDPEGMANFFERLQQANRFNQLHYPEFLMTHPVSESRIADAKARIAQLSNLPRRPPNERFALIKARIEIYTATNAQQALLTAQQRLKNVKSPSQSERYGLALALTINNQFTKAGEMAKLLLQESPNQPLYKSLLANIYWQDNQPKASLKLLADALALYPNNEPLVLQYASILLQDKQPKKAITVLENYLKRDPESPAAYSLSAEAHAQAANEWQAHEARAQLLMLHGDFQNAVEQLNMARSSAPKDNYVQAKLRATLAKAQDLAKKAAAN